MSTLAFDPANCYATSSLMDPTPPASPLRTIVPAFPIVGSKRRLETPIFRPTIYTNLPLPLHCTQPIAVNAMSSSFQHSVTKSAAPDFGMPPLIRSNTHNQPPAPLVSQRLSEPASATELETSGQKSTSSSQPSQIHPFGTSNSNVKFFFPQQRTVKTSMDTKVQKETQWTYSVSQRQCNPQHKEPLRLDWGLSGPPPPQDDVVPPLCSVSTSSFEVATLTRSDERASREFKKHAGVLSEFGGVDKYMENFCKKKQT